MADADSPARPPQPRADAPPGAASSPDLTGRMLGDFEILRKIGSGGMGQVYLARQLSLKRDVAVKLLRNELVTNPTALKRFEAEAHAVARLNHPNIVQVYHLGENDGLRYMALEFVDGRNLRDYLVRKGPPDLPVTLSVVRQVTLALQKAHEQGIVHRDIKPENILVTRKVEVKVTDFGLSRFFTGEAPALNLTQSGVTLGTPLYMSPEQVQGHTLDHRSDIYSFGVTCYHLLAGEPPFRGTTAFDVAMKHVHEVPKPLSEYRPDLPADLCAMVHKMMAKSPADRYQAAREILRDLARVREGLGLNLTQANSLLTSGAPNHTVLSLSGATSGEASVPMGATIAMPFVQRPIRWGRWLALIGSCTAAIAGGAFVHGRLHPSYDSSAAEAKGLVEIAPPMAPSLTRERELLKILESRETSPPDVISASIELGLLYLRENRLKEAEIRFNKLEEETFRGKFSTEHAQLAGRIGQAVVLAFRDKPTESNALVFKAIPKIGLKAPGAGMGKFREFMLANPSLSQALSEALNRNAANQRDQRLPLVLEQLRQARDLMRPMKE